MIKHDHDVVVTALCIQEYIADYGPHSKFADKLERYGIIYSNRKKHEMVLFLAYQINKAWSDLSTVERKHFSEAVGAETWEWAIVPELCRAIGDLESLEVMDSQAINVFIRTTISNQIAY